MPFAAAQIGLGFRNEIAPRNGLLRVREFCMAEIEHFLNPNDKRHPKFSSIASLEVVLFPADAQLTTGRTMVISLGEAVAKGMINNQTLAYFMGRTQLWAEKVGVSKQKMRFRQHLKTEMAHYAADCWDLEVQMSYGWIECVGHADRACYDLDQHSQRTGVQMVASERLPEPVQVEKLSVVPDKKAIGPRFKADQKKVITALEGLDEDQARSLQQRLSSEGSADVQGFSITSDLVAFETTRKTIIETKYTPSVIEPSYGIGRLLYAVLEHAFSTRSGDEQRGVMAFRPCVAPIKVGVFRLINHAPFDPVVAKIRDLLSAVNLTVRVDSSSGSVGRRYARADELGIPFGITVDFQTLLDNTVTLRDRDSMAQVRLSITSVVQVLQQLVEETVSWETIMQRFLVVKTGGEEEEDEEEDGEGKSSSKEKVAVSSNKPVVVEYTTRGAFSRPNLNFKPQP
eukprot:scaffold473_cov159-Ochromonas_danica.AAC.15